MPEYSNANAAAARSSSRARPPSTSVPVAVAAIEQRTLVEGRIPRRRSQQVSGIASAASQIHGGDGTARSLVSQPWLGSAPASELHDTVAVRLRDAGQRITASRTAARRCARERAEAPHHPGNPGSSAPGTSPTSSAYRNLLVLEGVGVVHRIVTTDDHASLRAGRGPHRASPSLDLLVVRHRRRRPRVEPLGAIGTRKPPTRSRAYRVSNPAPPRRSRRRVLAARSRARSYFPLLFTSFTGRLATGEREPE